MIPEDWITAGYRRFELCDRLLNKSADYGLQKRFDDAQGKKYFITVYVYDWSKYPQRHGERFGFMPTVNFNLGNDEPFYDITINGTFDIAQCEIEMERLWIHFGMPYYEEFDK